MNYIEIKQILEQEKNWCEKNKGKSKESDEFERGFIEGIKQADLMIKTLSKTR